MGNYKIVEKFISINGEAQNAGELACFIRFAGCNLNCGYCDTKWANEKDVSYEVMTEKEICRYIENTGVKNVTLTGGEPLIQDGIKGLIDYLLEQLEIRVEVETNGSQKIEDYQNRNENLSFTLDYKLPGSGMEGWMELENYKFLKSFDTVKFVISNHKDFERAKEIIDQYKLVEKCKVYLSTAFSEITPAEIVDEMVASKMNKVRLQLQMHKYIWDPNRKGV